MSDGSPESLKAGTPAGGAGDGMKPPPMARSVRRTPAQVITASGAVDAFAVPSDTNHSDEAQTMPGMEPAIFGGLNPPVLGLAGTTPAEEVPNPLGDNADAAGDEEVAPALLLGGGRGDLKRAARSTPVLLFAMLVCLIGFTWLFHRAMPRAHYAEVAIELRNFADLDPDEAEAFRREVAQVVGTPAFRDAARSELRKAHDGMPDGFLARGGLFQRARSMRIDEQGYLHLRHESDDPRAELPRMEAIAAAFVGQMQGRTTEAKQLEASLAARRSLLAEWEAQLAEADEAERDRYRPRVASVRAEVEEVERALARLVVAGEVRPASYYDNRPLRRNGFYAIWIACVVGFGGAIAMRKWQAHQQAKQRRMERRRRSVVAVGLAEKRPDARTTRQQQA